MLSTLVSVIVPSNNPSIKRSGRIAVHDFKPKAADENGRSGVEDCTSDKLVNAGTIEFW